MLRTANSDDRHTNQWFESQGLRILETALTENTLGPLASTT